MKISPLISVLYRLIKANCISIPYFPKFCAGENIFIDTCAVYMLMNIDFISIDYFLKFCADENIFIDIRALLLLNTFAR